MWGLVTVPRWDRLDGALGLHGRLYVQFTNMMTPKCFGVKKWKLLTNMIFSVDFVI